MPYSSRHDQSSPERGPAALAQTVLNWTLTHLAQRGYPRPACKRLAFLVTGMLAASSATRGDLATALEELGLSGAKDESIARRLGRLLDDADLDPSRLLPDLYRDLVPLLLQSVVASHTANQKLPPFHHRRFPPLRIILDATTKGDQVHILVAGLAYRGIVLPLAIRTWEQNVPLEAASYWTHLLSLCHDVQTVLPAALRDHILFCADRFFGVPRMLDLCRVLGWSSLLRLQGQTRILRSDGTVLAAKDLAPQPGTLWLSDPTPTDLTLASPSDSPAEEAPPVGGFKEAGWRYGRVVACWAEEADEPWLLLTDLPATPERLADYARRWAIERLFLTWKSHGWRLESLRIRAPQRLARFLSGLAIATLWTVACALPKILRLKADLATRGQDRFVAVEQLPLPWDLPSPPSRPWPAKFSLLTWGRKVLFQTIAGHRLLHLRWDFPDWDAPTWSVECQALYHGST